MPRRTLRWLPIAAMGLGAVALLLAAAWTYRLGFPLDDAWIYQAIARTWLRSGTWGIRAGQPAAGATAPLWVLLVAPGHLLPWPFPMVWTWLLGLGLLGVVLWSAMGEAQRHLPALAWLPPLLLAWEWHLLWAALSGMEIPLFLALLWFTLAQLRQEQPRWGLVGWLVGLGLWVRPEAVLWLLPWAWRMAWVPAGQRRRAVFHTLYPLLLMAGLYVLVQVALTGAPWPNTASAKVVEYSVLRQQPYLQRWLRMWLPLLAGVAVALLPWVPLGMRAYDRPWAWGEALWMLAHLSLYAWRLPVTYQHGRYVLPVLLPLVWWGGYGLARLQPTRWPPRWAIRLRLAGLALALGLLVGFLGLGLRAYALDVAIIESEMVDTAFWVRENLPPQETLAVHDIGAMAYFAPQPLLDLAGLVNPEVIPILRNEDALARYLLQRQVRYLVTFPGWYPRLVACARPIYQGDKPFSPSLGGEHMTVYRWQPCPDALQAESARTRERAP